MHLFLDTDGNKTTTPPVSTTNSPATAPPTEEETDDPPLDPCSNYSLLPNAYDRYYYNIINGSSGSVLHDRHLVEGWYRAGLSLDMPTVAPSHLYCGTYFPVWLNGESKQEKMLAKKLYQHILLRKYIYFQSPIIL